jgi:hypothetical protein
LQIEVALAFGLRPVSRNTHWNMTVNLHLCIFLEDEDVFEVGNVVVSIIDFNLIQLGKLFTVLIFVPASLIVCQQVLIGSYE